MRVIAEFVDGRNGKRYAPGSGNSINPALTAEQIEGLKKAGCLADGEEATKVDSSAGTSSAAAGNGQAAGADKPDYSSMTVTDLKNLASQRGLDISGVKNKADLAGVHEAADKAEAEKAAADASQDGQQGAGK